MKPPHDEGSINYDLYVDNMLLLLSNPASFIPGVRDIVEKYQGT